MTTIPPPFVQRRMNVVAFAVTGAAIAYVVLLLVQQRSAALGNLLRLGGAIEPTYYVRAAASLLVGIAAAGAGARLALSERVLARMVAIAFGAAAAIAYLSP